MTPIRLFIWWAYDTLTYHYVIFTPPEYSLTSLSKAFGFLVASKQPRSILVLSLIGLAVHTYSHEREPDHDLSCIVGAHCLYNMNLVIGPPPHLKSPHMWPMWPRDKVLVLGWGGPPFVSSPLDFVLYYTYKSWEKGDQHNGFGAGPVRHLKLSTNETKHNFSSCCRTFGL